MRAFGSSRDSLGELNILQALRSKGARFWMENGALHYRAPRGVVTAEHVAAIRRAERVLIDRTLKFAPSRKDEVRQWQPRLLKRLDATRAPLAFSQLGHWNWRAGTGYKPIRQVASATRLHGRLDTGALKEALSIIVTRHEALRTRIVVQNGVPAQEIAERRRCDLTVVDLAATPEHHRDIEVQRQITSAIVDATDYEFDPLFLAELLILGPNDSVLILAMDHVISDGASLSIVFSEVLSAQAQLVKGAAPSLPPVQMQLGDYAAWQQAELPDWLQSHASEWSDWPRMRFPCDSPGREVVGWGTMGFVIDSSLKSALQNWARQHGTSLVTTVLTGYVGLLLRWCETSEVIVQSISDGRISEVLENTVGDLMFPLYLRIIGDQQSTFIDLLKIVTEEYCRACERPDFDYNYVRDPLPELVRNTIFNWLPRRDEYQRPNSDPDDPMLTWSHVSFEDPAFATFDWDGEPRVIFWDRGSEVIGQVSFPREQFSYSRMRRFSENFRRFLAALVRSPPIRIGDVSLI